MLSTKSLLLVVGLLSCSALTASPRESWVNTSQQVNINTDSIRQFGNLLVFHTRFRTNAMYGQESVTDALGFADCAQTRFGQILLKQGYRVDEKYPEFSEPPSLFSAYKDTPNGLLIEKACQIAATNRPLMIEDGRAMVRVEEKIGLALTKDNCDEASALVKNFRHFFEGRDFQIGECILKRQFRNTVASKDPQTMYLAAVKYETEGERAKAKTVYESITTRFSKSPLALKAADRLTSLVDVESIERSNQGRADAVAASNRESAQRSLELNASVNRANSAAADRAYNQCRIEMDACWARNGSSCYRNCDTLRR